MAGRCNGTVKFFNAEKGYGFITCEDEDATCGSVHTLTLQIYGSSFREIRDMAAQGSMHENLRVGMEARTCIYENLQR